MDYIEFCWSTIHFLFTTLVDVYQEINHRIFDEITMIICATGYSSEYFEHEFKSIGEYFWYLYSSVVLCHY